MKYAGWLAVVVLVGLISLAWGQLSAEDLPGPVSGNLIIDLKELSNSSEMPLLNPIPVGNNGLPTGFAFAPGRTELAYTAIEESSGSTFSVLRIVQANRLWPVPQTEMKTVRDSQGKPQQYPEFKLLPLPFDKRERTLVSLPAPKSPKSFMEGPILWSPDGTKLLVFAATELPSGEYASRDLWLIDYATGKRQVLTKAAWVSEAAWSPNSAWIALVNEQTEQKSKAGKAIPTKPGLWLFKVGAGTLRLVENSGVHPQWSAKSDVLQFAAAEKAARSLAYTLATGKTKASATPVLGDLPWQLSPDKRYTAAVTSRSSKNMLEVTENSAKAVRLAVPASGMGGWQPAGKLLAFVHPNGTPAITTIEGPHRARVFPLGNGDIPVDALPYQAAIQWSVVTIPADYAKDMQESLTPGEGMSWLAFISKGQLRLMFLLHRRLQPAEALAVNVPPGPLPKQAEVTIVMSNSKQIALALLMYAQDWDERLPPSSDAVEQMVAPYVKNQELFMRPGRPKEKVFRYLANGVALGDIPNPAETAIGVIDYWRDGGIVSYADGHVKWHRRQELADIIRRSEDVFFGIQRR